MDVTENCKIGVLPYCTNENKVMCQITPQKTSLQLVYNMCSSHNKTRQQLSLTLLYGQCPKQSMCQIIPKKDKFLAMSLCY